MLIEINIRRTIICCFGVNLQIIKEILKVVSLIFSIANKDNLI